MNPPIWISGFEVKATLLVGLNSKQFKFRSFFFPSNVYAKWINMTPIYYRVWEDEKWSFLSPPFSGRTYQEMRKFRSKGSSFFSSPHFSLLNSFICRNLFGKMHKKVTVYIYIYNFKQNGYLSFLFGQGACGTQLVYDWNINLQFY